MGAFLFILILALAKDHIAEGDRCGICGQHQTCLNKTGMYICKCSTGFTYKSTKQIECEDINECRIPNVCENGTCINTIGSYYCKCGVGLKYLKGGLCDDVNECMVDPLTCGDHSTCLNTNGSYKCDCVPGFRMEPTTNKAIPEQCVDTNECQIDRLCGEGGTCHNLIGSYWCQCSDGFSNYGNNQTKCVELSCDQLKQQPGQTLPGFDNLLILMEDNCLMLRNSSSSGPKGETLTGDVLLKALVNATDVVQLGLQDRAGQPNSSDVTIFLRTVENSLRLIAPQLTENFTRIRTNSTEAEILVNRDRTQPTGPVSLTNENAQLDTTWETVVGDEQNYPGFAFVLLLSYKTLSSLNVSSSLQSQQLMSSVATVSISNPNSENLLQPVKLTFNHLQSSGADLDCAYWSEEDGLGAWSGRGCTTVMSNSTHIICSCNHLSSFAVIQGLQQQKESNGFSSVMWVCLLLALACVVISLITTIWCRFVSRKRHRGHSQQSAQFQTK